MASIETAVRTYTLEDATLAGLIATRIYPNRLPVGAVLPAINYFRVSTTPIETHDGASTVDFSRLQFTIYGATKAIVDTVATALLTRLRNAKFTRNAREILRVEFVAELDMDLSPEELRADQYARALDFRVAYRHT